MKTSCSGTEHVPHAVEQAAAPAPRTRVPGDRWSPSTSPGARGAGCSSDRGAGGSVDRFDTSRCVLSGGAFGRGDAARAAPRRGLIRWAATRTGQGTRSVHPPTPSHDPRRPSPPATPGWSERSAPPIEGEVRFDAFTRVASTRRTRPTTRSSRSGWSFPAPTDRRTCGARRGANAVVCRSCPVEVVRPSADRRSAEPSWWIVPGTSRAMGVVAGLEGSSPTADREGGRVTFTANVTPGGASPDDRRRARGGARPSERRV